MGEIKRKRPWESEEIQMEEGMQNTLILQFTASLVIAMGIIVGLNTQNNNAFREMIKIELKKNIEIQDISAAAQYVKMLTDDYMR